MQGRCCVLPCHHLFPLAPLGSGSEGAQTSLQEVYSKVGSAGLGVRGPLPTPSPPCTQEMTLAEAEVHILTILKQIMEEKLTSVNIQVGWHWRVVQLMCL